MEDAYLSVWTSISLLKLQALSELFTAYLHNTLALAQLSLPTPISDVRYARVENNKEPHPPPSHTPGEKQLLPVSSSHTFLCPALTSSPCAHD